MKKNVYLNKHYLTLLNKIKRIQSIERIEVVTMVCKFLEVPCPTTCSFYNAAYIRDYDTIVISVAPAWVSWPGLE